MPCPPGRLLAWNLVALTLLAPVASGQEPPTSADQKESETLNRRAGDVLSVLHLGEPAAEGRVRTRIIDFYRGLRSIQAERDQHIQAYKAEANAPKPDRRIDGERALAIVEGRKVADRFLSGLAEDLSPEQIDAVQDKLTYGKRPLTYNGYLDMLPSLTGKQKEVIHRMLTQARDQAVSAGSAEEKTAIFDRFKGRVNNYLSAQGYDLKQAGRDWAERRKAKEQAARPAQPRWRGQVAGKIVRR